jgi:hypothetical protein
MAASNRTPVRGALIVVAALSLIGLLLGGFACTVGPYMSAENAKTMEVYGHPEEAVRIRAEWEQGRMGRLLTVGVSAVCLTVALAGLAASARRK